MIGTVTEFGGPTSATPLTAGSFPVGITTGPSPTGATSPPGLWFAELVGNQIGFIDPQTGAIQEFGGPTAATPLTPGSRPQGITTGPSPMGAASPTGIWFTETGLPDQPGRPSANHGRVGFLDPTTGAITEFGGPTSATPITPDSGPNAITTGPDNNIWFTEVRGDRIGRIDPTTGTVTEFGGPTSATPLTAGSAPGFITTGPSPTGATSPPGLWFTEEGANRIGFIDPITGTIQEFGGPTSATPLTPDGFPQGITTGPSPMGAASPTGIWFTEAGLPDQPGRPSANHGRIGFLDPTTGAITEFGSPTSATPITPDSGPRFITTGSDNNIWFTEQTANKIGRMDTNGVLLNEFSMGITSNSGPIGITSGPDGNLWFTEIDPNQGNKIGRITTI